MFSWFNVFSHLATQETLRKYFRDFENDKADVDAFGAAIDAVIAADLDPRCAAAAFLFRQTYEEIRENCACGQHVRA